MDASPIQSVSKCSGSDFSIERILGEKKVTRKEDLEAPEWLCCTRYRPPRIPRGPASRTRRAGRHARVPFTAAQASALEAAYARAPYLAPPALKALAAALNLRDDRIKIWFQNRRARERREKSVSILPPDGVTLPPTSLSCPSSSMISSTRLQSNIISSPPTFNLQPINFLARGNHDLINAHRFQVPMNYLERIHEPRQDQVELRPSSPLDIESVDD